MYTWKLNKNQKGKIVTINRCTYETVGVGVQIANSVFQRYLSYKYIWITSSIYTYK